MAKEDTASGLLSKLVKFVRNPATNWAELDSVDADNEDAVSKQLLKEMMERKRRNDFVRKREFDMLRKIRKLQTLADADPQPAGRPSFFQSSLISRPDERAVTLKKIDDIEAQMSMQWWKTKNHTARDASSASALLHGSDEVTQAPIDSLLPVAYRPTMPGGPDSVRTVDAPAQEPMLDDLLKPSIQDADSRHTERWSSAGDAQALHASSSAGFGSVRVSQVPAHDAELEEAAIFFANGDDAGAQASLLDILAQGALRENDVPSWLTLFDLYRATGAQEKFEAAAIAFAERFDRSAPQWLCLSDLPRESLKPGGTVAGQGAADWVCPSVLGLQSVAVLNAATGRTAAPWQLDWSRLKTIEHAALEPLYKVFCGWAGQPVQLRFKGDTHLRDVLLDATRSGQQTTAQQWWLLRMEALRVMDRPDEFELAALDFCVTYEVSPPAWAVARCDYRSLDEPHESRSTAADAGGPCTEYMPSTFNPMSLEGRGRAASQLAARQVDVVLAGQLQGHSALVLERLDASLAGGSAGTVQISCAQLIRVDFSAAGMLLNWAAARQAENIAIRFTQVNRLVASFFNVIGITEYAEVTVRLD